jgi:thiol-disulfide isomerase/thioredoxin
MGAAIMLRDRIKRGGSGLLILAAFAAAPLVVPFVTQTFKTVPPARFFERNSPVVLPNVTFRDSNGTTRSLSEFKGKTVLLNLWATWCAPCRQEMPSLDRLQAKLGSEGFQVVTLSMDRAGIRPVLRFFEELAITNLTSYIDDSGEGMYDLGATGLPTSLLINAEGQEVARLIGPAEWDSPEVLTFLKGRIAD